MQVDSYLEVFTTLFGWMFYGVLWDVLLQTGIVYLPFLGILLENWKKPLTETRIETASEWSVRSVEFQVLAALFVVVLAAQPTQLTTLQLDSISYTPVPTINNPEPTPVDFRTNPSTFGKSGFVDPHHSVSIPAWWYAVLALSSGINHASVEGLPRSNEIRQAVQLARMLTIKSPKLRDQVARFYNECYVPARSKYYREKPTSIKIQSLLEDTSNQDPEWLGSHIYRFTRGYYDHFRASNPVENWPYIPSRDTEYDPANPPKYGRPYCDEWWEQKSRGLRDQLMVSINPQASNYSNLLIISGLALGSEKYKDVLVKSALLNQPSTWSNSELAKHNRVTSGWLSYAEGLVKTVLTTAGTAVAATFTTLTISILLQLLPILQALILLGIYTLLPPILVLSRYSFGVMISMGITIFGIKFWTVLWYLAQWVDQNLITSMYPDTNVFIENFFLGTEHGGKRILLNTATTMMYIGLPVLWSIAMGWAGIRAGRSVDAVASPYSRVASDAGSQSASVLRKLA